MSAWFYWDPNPDMFVIPYLNHPIRWYGLCFVSGFILAYFLLIHMFNKKFSSDKKLPKDIGYLITDKLTWFVIAGTLIGSRLGHVFFYDWPYYQNHLSDIFKVWEGGLASHGGALGIIISLFIFSRLTPRFKLPKITFLELLDYVSVPTALGACCIRIGNFFNQEILGTETSAPWGIIFGHPADGSFPTPRHPVQLYEAAAYLFLFVLLYSIWKYKRTTLKPGVIFGLLLTILFSARFIIEFWKTPQTYVIDQSVIQIGQYLSIPFILIGLYLLSRNLFKPQENE